MSGNSGIDWGWKKERKKEGMIEGENRLLSLIRLLTPGSKDYEKALNGTPAGRRRSYKKYKIIDG